MFLQKNREINVFNHKKVARLISRIFGLFLLFGKMGKFLPVFPEVGSIMVSPGFKRPAFSASSTILLAILSFTLPPALKYSHLATRNREIRKLPIKRREILHKVSYLRVILT